MQLECRKTRLSSICWTLESVGNYERTARSGKLFVLTEFCKKHQPVPTELCVLRTKRNCLNFLGTPRFSSRAGHNNQEQSFKDDLEVETHTSSHYTLSLFLFLYNNRIPHLDVDLHDGGHIRREGITLEALTQEYGQSIESTILRVQM